MNTKTFVSAYLLVLLSSFSPVLWQQSQHVEAADSNKPISKNTTLKFNNLSDSQEVDLQDFMDQRMKTPQNCYDPGIICKENIEIKFIREWNPTPIEDLSADEFAKLVPPIKGTIGRNASPSEIAIAQQALNLRGLLLDLNGEPVKTLGNWKHLSEMARARLSYIKGKDLTDEEFTNEINQLIERMKDPNYLKNRPLPSQIDPQPGQVGYAKFNQEKDKAEKALNQTYTGPKTVTIPRKSLELDGSVKLYTKPGQ